jgi:malto-oligosyltrehalose synthase/4-alpha-glucanotransferase
MFDPVSTYRIQFHKDFTFSHLMGIIPYLHDLGVITIYASPIFEAVPGSNHGYDVINPHRINPEIGTLQELEAISTKLRELGMHWIQDIVPNHMAFDPGNAWLMDVLEKGQASPFSRFFDISWDVPAFKGKLMVPFLGSSPDTALASGELGLSYKGGEFNLTYAEQRYPLNIKSVSLILESGNASQVAAVKKRLSALKNSPSVQDIAEKIAGLSKSDQELLHDHIQSSIKQINKDKTLLQRIIDAQFYRLSFWQDSDHQINYRRFFTVNGLICLNIQDENVFTIYHSFLKTLLDKGLVQGLRVDHIDGLFDPKTYLERLRSLAGEQTYIVVEKILEQGEQFPRDWPVQGNTGYDFLGVVNNLLSEPKSKKVFTTFYRELASDHKPVGRAIPEKKSNILYGHMAGELDNLYELFRKLKSVREDAPNIAPEQWKAVIAGFLIQCPVYRYYGNQKPLDPAEAAAVKSIFDQVCSANPELSIAAGYLSNLFTGKGKQKDEAAILKFYQRCMQFTGPLMAKGVEDTLMYTYDRFIGHNDVGDSPQEFGITIDHFHRWMKERQAQWPMSMNSTSSHDTKRGEDVRARLNVLTDIPEKWLKQVRTWQQNNSKFKTGNTPDTNDEYLIYQTLAGFIALPGQAEDQTGNRLEAYLTKALREAKTHTQWAKPDEQYEKATLQFAKKLLHDAAFLKSMEHLQKEILDTFIANSLTQIFLKFTSPGIPDIYQGCELWDFSLVDPDNRRPVDYHLRTALLKQARQQDAGRLWKNRRNGTIKLWLTHKLLQERKNNAELFSEGDYIPLSVEGRYKEQLIAFARVHQRQWLVVASALHTVAIDTSNWADTRIILPADAPMQWKDILNDKKVLLNEEIFLNELPGDLPIFLLKSASPFNKRAAGIILPLTALPSPYGIGDMGPEARRFVNFLSSSHQRYWQMLPVNPTSAAAGHSPYSAFSSLAGNTLLISPDELANDGFLTEQEIAECRRPGKTRINYARAAAIKRFLLDIAYRRFNQNASGQLKYAYEKFKIKEQSWLQDFALYEAVKAYHGGIPWNEWAGAFKCREPETLRIFRDEHHQELDKSMWMQFIFSRQWQALKAFGHQNGILFFGDLPFYISYDSVDVWTYPNLFKLDDHKAMAGVAGVPPDYFNAAGQLWNMPVYSWTGHKTTGYAWWLTRIKKNMEFYDLIRLDHFRAFYDFWEVPPGEKNAIRGSWRQGPGAAIFRVFKKELGDLPFVAEDLGDISEGVYELRNRFKLPGMNVLQYAFGNDMPVSVHSPHNHVINSVTYTGTHDNNTLLGWFKEDITAEKQKDLKTYFRVPVTRHNLNRLILDTCYASVSAIAIVPMQDILGLDQRSRLNVPASKKGNWAWRLDGAMLTGKLAASLRLILKRYNR